MAELGLDQDQPQDRRAEVLASQVAELASGHRLSETTPTHLSTVLNLLRVLAPHP